MNPLHKAHGDLRGFSHFIVDVVVASDELGNKFNMMDVWHSAFYFIKEEDLLVAERFLKLKSLR